MSEKDQDKLNVKQVIRNSNSTKEDISKALREYFKKYLVEEKPELVTIFNGKL